MNKPNKKFFYDERMQLINILQKITKIVPIFRREIRRKKEGKKS